MEDIEKQKILEDLCGILKKHHLTIATAESCTGGYLSFLLTKIPGASAFYRYGMIVYSNESKTDILGIPDDLVKNEGAVSQGVAEIMAINIRKVQKTDIGLALTGIAGPDGGSIEKPVGTIYIGIDLLGKVYYSKYACTSLERNEIRVEGAFKALDFLLRQLTR